MTAKGPPGARLRALLAVRLVSRNPEALARFFVEGLGFKDEGEISIDAAEMRSLGVPGRGSRRRLRLGSERLDIDGFEARGADYPAGAQASDPFFQHFALVTPDIKAAYDKALGAGASSISTRGPVRLPPASGGVVAVKFRDPEGHPLEFIEAHGDGRAPRIDHSAISVRDVDRSLDFYEALGLAITTRTLNEGPEQGRLDGLDDPRVDVVGLAAGSTPPHLELLAYRGQEAAPALTFGCADVAATRLLWRGGGPALLRDPDGHRHQIADDAG